MKRLNLTMRSRTDKEKIMNKKIINFFYLLTALASLTVFPMYAHSDSMGSGSIQITSPKDGAVIDGKARNEVVFDVQHSANGNHLHFYVDDGNPTIVREWKGSFTLPSLSSGKHEICIKEAMVNHVLTGLQKCISVTAK
jgi:hypothetical protein